MIVGIIALIVTAMGCTPTVAANVAEFNALNTRIH